MSFEWVGRRWFEFRTGYGTYMVFLFGFSNFILILYNFAPQFKELAELPVFAIIVFAIILPSAVLIGHKHNKKQLPTEAKVQTVNSPYRDGIVPNSKETFNTEAAIFNQEMAIWQNKFSQWQLELTAKQYKVSNALVSKFDLDPSLKYNEEQFKLLDSYKTDLDKWEGGLTNWNTKYKKFLAGQDASTIQDTVIESKESKPELTSRYYKRINVDELKNTKTSDELHTQAMDDFSKAVAKEIISESKQVEWKKKDADMSDDNNMITHTEPESEPESEVVLGMILAKESLVETGFLPFEQKPKSVKTKSILSFLKRKKSDEKLKTLNEKPNKIAKIAKIVSEPIMYTDLTAPKDGNDYSLIGFRLKKLAKTVNKPLFKKSSNGEVKIKKPRKKLNFGNLLHKSKKSTPKIVTKVNELPRPKIVTKTNELPRPKIVTKPSKVLTPKVTVKKVDDDDGDMLLPPKT